MVQDGNKEAINNADSFYTAMKQAADGVERRAQKGLRTLSDPNLLWHATQSPENFKHLLSNMQAAQSSGLNSKQIDCYETAFPNWLYHIGVFVEETPQPVDNATCRGLLGLSN